MLKETFVELTGRWIQHSTLHHKLWSEIESRYTEKDRYYHTIAHLENLIAHLHEVKMQIQDWDTTLFAVFYHDIVYDAKSNTNEENSAIIAADRLTEISYPESLISKCTLMILATKGHAVSEDVDTNLFTDADLSILGQAWEQYSEYARQIRQEYAIYPDPVYNDGRKKVLNHFLQMDRIFKSDYFFEKCEENAKRNLRAEVKLLA